MVTGRLLTALVFGLGLQCSSVAWAQVTPVTPGNAVENQARKLVSESIVALASQQLPRARQLLERAYRMAPLPEVLLQLGRLAQAEGRGVPAADLFRRYMDSVGDQADAATKATIAQHRAALQEPVSEVHVVASEGSLFLVDGRLVGQTPLPGPLLVAPGPRRFAIETGGVKYESDPLNVPEARPSQVNLTPGARGSAIAVLSLTPAMLLGLTMPTASPRSDTDKSWADSVKRAVSAAVEKEQTVLVSQDRLAPLLRGQPADCLTQPQCQEQLADRAEARSILRVAVDGFSWGTAANYRFTVTVHDVATGQTAASTVARCDACSQSAALGQLDETVRRMVTEANNRPRGVLTVASTPVGADVLLDGMPVGKTPLERMSFAGPHSVTINQSGYAPYESKIDVVLGETASVKAGLVRLARGRKRPLWRLVVGGVALGGGLLAAGFGISGVAYYGQCGDNTPPPDGLLCQTVYLTRVIGGSLLGGGLALSLAGVVLLALPASRTAQATTSGVSDSSGVAVSLKF